MGAKVIAYIQENPWTFVVAIMVGLAVGVWLVKLSKRANGR